MHWAIRQLELELGIEGPGRGAGGQSCQRLLGWAAVPEKLPGQILFQISELCPSPGWFATLSPVLNMEEYLPRKRRHSPHCNE